MEEIRKILNWKTVTRGAIIFFVFTVAGFLISFLWKGSKDIHSVLRSVNWRFLILMLLLIFVDWILMGYRLYIFANKMSKQVSFLDCFRANLVGTFMAIITPSQTGGWAGQFYILYRAGLTGAGGVAITVITYLFTLIFLLFSTPFVIAFHSQLYSGKVALLVQYCLIMFGLASASLILLLIKPDLILRLLTRLSSSRIVKLNHHVYNFFQNGMSRLGNLIHEYKGFISLFIRQKKRTFLFGVVITFAIYFNRTVTGYVIVKALGNQTTLFWHVIVVQILLIYISYFSPTPGASGISEFSSTFFMNPIMRQGTAFFFTTLWRFSNSYLELFVGGIIMIIQLRKEVFQDAKHEFNSSDEGC
jgi:uncharacterized protein (TIRG00374 family)